MPQLPNAKASSPNLVKFSATQVFGPTTLGTEDKTAKLGQQPSDSDSFSKCFLPQAERLRKCQVSQLTKRLQEHKRQQRAFHLHFSKSKGHSAEWARSREQKQLPLLAKKIRQECCSDTELGAGEPLSKLLNRDLQQECTEKFLVGDKVEVRDRGMTEWQVGTVTDVLPLKVTLLAWDQQFEWDFVRPSQEEVTLSQAALRKRSKSLGSPTQSTFYKESAAKESQLAHASVPVASPELQCKCGNQFQLDAIFCSRCGRQRGCEVSKAHPARATKPCHPSAPIKPVAPFSTSPMRRSSSSSDFVSWLRRHREAEKTLPLPHFSAERVPSRQRSIDNMGSPGPAFNASEDIRSHADFRKTWSSPPSSPISRSPISAGCTESNASLLSVRRMNCQHRQWQQLTVPILAENGDIVKVHPLYPGKEGVWKQDTVPIVGENGEVIALRPASHRSPMQQWRPVSLPIFNDQGNIIALPSGGRHDWPPESVPILAGKGEVIGLRPPRDDHGVWKQQDVPIFGENGVVVAICPCIGSLKRWEMLTVPLLTENGEFISLHPPEDHPDVSMQNALGEVLAPTSMSSDCRLTSSPCLSSSWNRTHLPPSLLMKIMNKGSSEGNCTNTDDRRVCESGASLASPGSSRWAKKDQGRSQPGQPFFITEPDPGDTLEVESLFSSSVPCMAELQSQTKAQEGAEKSGRADGPETCCNQALLLDLPAMPTISGTPTPTSPATHRTSASFDSFASIRDVIRMANDAKQATPDDHMVKVLQEALAAGRPGSAGSCVSAALRSDAPEAQEIEVRLHQLPELWRDTILRLLEEAESFQLADPFKAPTNVSSPR